MVLCPLCYDIDRDTDRFQALQIYIFNKIGIRTVFKAVVIQGTPTTFVHTACQKPTQNDVVCCVFIFCSSLYSFKGFLALKNTKKLLFGACETSQLSNTRSPRLADPIWHCSVLFHFNCIYTTYIFWSCSLYPRKAIYYDVNKIFSMLGLNIPLMAAVDGGEITSGKPQRTKNLN